MQALQSIIDGAFEERAALSPETISPEIKNAITESLELLDAGKVRIAEKIDGEWHVHQWLKKAVLLYFRTHENAVMPGGFTQFYDKVPLKYQHQTEAELQAGGVRI